MMLDVFFPDGPALIWVMFDGNGTERGKPAFKLWRHDADGWLGVEPDWVEDYNCEGWEMCLTGGGDEMEWMMEKRIPPYHPFQILIQPSIWMKGMDTWTGDGEWEVETYGDLFYCPPISDEEAANLWLEGTDATALMTGVAP